MILFPIVLFSWQLLIRSVMVWGFFFPANCSFDLGFWGFLKSVIGLLFIICNNHKNLIEFSEVRLSLCFCLLMLS